MTPYHKLVSDYAHLLKQGRSFPLGTFEPARHPALGADAPKALFLAPHPDDECISGGIAVRLLREARMNVINVAVTLGSKKERHAGRLQEVTNACRYLGFGLVVAGVRPSSGAGLQNIHPKTRESEPAHWSACVGAIREIIETNRPKVLIFPHEGDWNSTHIGTHFLAMDALKQMPSDFECFLVETEFWGAMSDPNLLVEISRQDLGDMMAATSFHIGEVGRNPYHLLLPAWMMDNVRRGAEVAGGQGGAAPDFAFAALYRLRKWSRGQAERFFEGGKQTASSTNIGQLFA